MNCYFLPKCVYFSKLGARALNGNPVTCRYLNVGGSTRQICTRNNGHFDFLKVTRPFRTVKVKPGTSNCFGKPFARYYSRKEFAGPKTLDAFRRRDGVPKSYELIYRTTFPNMLLMSQLFVFISAGAVITAGLVYLVREEKTEEEKRLFEKKIKAKVEERDRQDREEGLGKMLHEIKDGKGITDVTASYPKVEEFFDPDNEGQLMVAVVVSFLVLAVSLFRIQRYLPVRIYVNNKDHCIAIMYGHILPGKLTWHEFLAGTVQHAGKSKLMNFYSDHLYKDGSGRRLILLDQFFRSSSDYNRIMGCEQPLNDDDDTN